MGAPSILASFPEDGGHVSCWKTLELQDAPRTKPSIHKRNQPADPLPILLMSLPESSELAPTLYDYILHQAQPPEKFGHSPRLYALTQQIGATESYDDDAVYVHDLGVFTGHRPEDLEQLKAWDNTAYAIAQTRPSSATPASPKRQSQLSTKLSAPTSRTTPPDHRSHHPPRRRHPGAVRRSGRAAHRLQGRPRHPLANLHPGRRLAAKNPRHPPPAHPRAPNPRPRRTAYPNAPHLPRIHPN